MGAEAGKAISSTRRLTSLALVLGVALPGGHLAAQAAASRPSAAMAVADKDQAAVDAARDALDHGGFAALKDHLAALEQVEADTPQPLTRVEAEATPYSTAAFLLGSYDNETGRYESALARLEFGLALTPANLLLVGEKGVALNALHRWNEAFQVYVAGLAAAGPSARDTDKARLLRGEGFSLTELRRYDEAETAYRASLALEPEHGGALAELAYIAKLKAGGVPEQAKLFNGEEAKRPR